MNTALKLKASNAKLLEALKIAREYVASVHGTIASATGNCDTCVKSDLDKIDAIIAVSENNQ